MRKIKNSTILITGGAGFIGSHLADSLLKLGANIVIVDDFSNGRMENLASVEKSVTIIEYDISGPMTMLKKLMTKYRLNGIFHLACFPRSMSLQNPFRDIEVNAIGTLNVLELAKINYNCKVVFTSNSGIYGNPEYLPIDEKHPDNPSTPYDANKLVSEYYMKIYHKIYKLPIGICRLATVYGERQRTKEDWKPVIPEFAINLMQNKRSTIYWNGRQTRDLIYVKDVVQGLIEAFLTDTKGETFILGTNTETSVNTIYNTVKSLLNKKILPRRAGKVHGDIKRMKLSYNKAHEWFNFKPKYTLADGIQNYIDWLKT